MPRNLSAAFVAASKAGTCRPFSLAEIWDSAGALRVWSGYGDLAWNGQTWIGTGNLGSASEVQETVEIYAVGLEFRFVGAPAALISVCLSTAQQGLPAALYQGFFDKDTGAVVQNPALVWEGLVDVPSINDSAESASIVISAENRLVKLEQAPNRRYTHEDQQRDYPGDKGFEYVPIVQDGVVSFGG